MPTRRPASPAAALWPDPMNLTLYTTLDALLDERSARINDYRQRAEARAGRGDPAGARFDNHLLALHVSRDEKERPALLYAMSAGVGATLRHSTRAQWATILEDASEPGCYRYQLYDADGFSSHSTHPSLLAAVAVAVAQGYRVPDEAGAATVRALPSFSRGNRIAALLQEHNTGRLSWDEYLVRADAVQREAEPAAG